MNRSIFRGFAVLAIVVLGGCAFKNGKIPSNSGNTLRRPILPAQPATYSQVYDRILSPKCGACHGPGEMHADFSNYAYFITDTDVVVPGHPEQSGMYTRTLSGDMPRRAQALSPEELGLIYSWIEAGAQNN